MLVIAAVRDDGYNFVLVLHILAAIVSFAPAIATVVSPRSIPSGDEVVRTGRIVYGPALILTGLLGVVMVLMSDDAWEFNDGWISMAFLGWIALVGVYQALVTRGAKEGGDAGRRKVVLGTQIVAGLAVVMVYLMVFKPGA